MIILKVKKRQAFTLFLKSVFLEKRQGHWGQIDLRSCFRVKYLLFVIDILTKYAWIKPLNNKIFKKILNGFIEIVNKCKRQRNKLWLHQGR